MVRRVDNLQTLARRIRADDADSVYDALVDMCAHADARVRSEMRRHGHDIEVRASIVDDDDAVPPVVEVGLTALDGVVFEHELVELDAQVSALLLEYLSDPWTAATEVTALLLTALGCPAGRVWLMDGDGLVSDVPIAASASLRQLLGQVGETDRPHGLVDVAWQRRSPAWSAGIDRGSLDPADVEGLPLGSVLAIPITGNADPMGVIELFMREQRPPEPELLVLLAGIGDRLGNVFELSRMHMRLLRQAREEFDRAIRDYRVLLRHRVMNPLAIIKGSALTILARCEVSQPGPTLLQGIVDAGERIEHMSYEVEQLHGSERELHPNPQVGDGQP